MLPYAAYLRVYEPLAAFTNPQRAFWEDYALSDRRPRPRLTLEAEHAEAVRRMIAVPPIVAPPHESAHAYLRRVEDTLYVSPWQSRLRSWLAFVKFSGSTPANLMDRFVPGGVAEQTLADFEKYKQAGGTDVTLRTHILSSTWHVPTAWFVPFDPTERWLRLSDPGEGGRDSGATTATRNLIYVTSMGHARKRVARALAVIRRHLDEAGPLIKVEDVGRWLEEFHPHSLVELDYGGLVHLLDDEALRTDQSVGEIAAALTGLDSGQEELSAAMYQRVTTRWRSVQALESAN
ncbi:hypothetical protein [Rhizohabitans arisaemae]|uniref:hypothetical protein n=1 Tax=Rhizohabitans arisaemae TaxID=2720610 RepID=UPI0024B18668|nr:hypothetical protein [Rhizohabitans arisaemae]